jgi:Palmitoyl protein thioesterase
MKRNSTIFVLALGSLFFLLVSCFRVAPPAQGSEVNTQAGGLVLSTSPVLSASNMFVDTTIEVKFSEAMNQALTGRAISVFTGTYAPASNPANFSKLQLTAMCDGKWRVRNSNAFPLSFNWDVYQGSELGVGVVPANSDAFFYGGLRPQTGNKTVRLFVNGQQQQVKANNTNTCNPENWSATWSADGKTASFASKDVFAANSTLTVVLSTLTQNRSGSSKLSEPYTFTFSTGSKKANGSTQGTVGANGGSLTLDGTTLTVDPSFLTMNTNVKLSTNAQRPSFYPSEVSSTFPADIFEPIGLNTIVEIPYSAINTNVNAPENRKNIVVKIPWFQNATPQDITWAEIRIQLADGSEYFYVEQYRPVEQGYINNSVTINNLLVKNLLSANPPTSAKISIQPVKVRIPPPFTDEGAITAQDTSYSPLDVLAPGRVNEGMYYIPNTVDPDALLNMNRTVQVVPSGVRSSLGSEPFSGSGKKPLVIFHGTLAPDDALGQVAISTPGVYGNRKILAKLLRDPEITAKYDIYVFGYDSRQHIDRAAAMFRDARQNMFGDSEIDVVAYSQGGVVFRTYDHLVNKDTNVTNVVTYGTPHEGAWFLKCVANDGTYCTSASALSGALTNPLLPAGVAARINLFYMLRNYPGILDMTTEFSDPLFLETGNPFLQRLNQDWASFDYSNYTGIHSDDKKFEEARLVYRFDINPRSVKYDCFSISIGSGSTRSPSLYQNT